MAEVSCSVFCRQFVFVFLLFFFAILFTDQHNTHMHIIQYRELLCVPFQGPSFNDIQNKHANQLGMQHACSV